MKKRIIAATSFVLMVAMLALSVYSASAAVYVQDEHFRYQVFNDNTVAWAGYSSDSVDDVVVPRYFDQSTVVSVAAYGLENNTHINSVDFMEAPELHEIGQYAFYGCTSLTSVVIPDSITTVNISAFRNCTALKDVEFYGNQNIIPMEAFYNCISLKNVQISVYTKSILGRAFANCTSLEYFEIPDSVKYIAPNAFDGDENLTLGVWYDSYAYEYAKEQNIPYVLLDGVKLGDANGDGIVNVNDVTAIQRHLAQIQELEGIHLHAADTNLDGVDDVTNVTTLQGFLAEFETEYPIGEVMTQ